MFREILQRAKYHANILMNIIPCVLLKPYDTATSKAMLYR